MREQRRKRCDDARTWRYEGNYNQSRRAISTRRFESSATQALAKKMKRGAPTRKLSIARMSEVSSRAAAFHNKGWRVRRIEEQQYRPDGQISRRGIAVHGKTRVENSDFEPMGDNHASKVGSEIM